MKRVLKSLCLGAALAPSLLLSSQTQNLEALWSRTTIQLDHEIIYNDPGQELIGTSPAPMIAPWKNGYLVAYLSSDFRSWFFFTDSAFNKTSSEREVADRLIYSVETGNNEIAFLTGKPCYKDRVYSDHIYFTKVDDRGRYLVDEKIIGSKNIHFPKQSEFYSQCDQQLLWTGEFYTAMFSIQHNFSAIPLIPDVHEADVNYYIRPNGEILSHRSWNVSHSFEQRLLLEDGELFCASQGDAYPRGIKMDRIEVGNYELLDFRSFVWKTLNLKGRSGIYFPNQLSRTTYQLKPSNSNYVPFSLGDLVRVNERTAMVSTSDREKKKYHDLGLSVLSKEKKPGDLRMITDTKHICEHSERLLRLSENRYLLLWKEFNAKTCDKELKKLQQEYGQDAKGRGHIFDHHNLDTRKIAIIDTNGQFVTPPQVLTTLDWHYNVSHMEYATPWHHNYIQDFSTIAYRRFLRTKTGDTILLHNRRKSSELVVQVLKADAWVDSTANL